MENLAFSISFFQMTGVSGGLGVAGGLGLTNGTGRFKKNQQEAKEKYKLFVFPLSLSAIYRFQMDPKQWLTPYTSAGLYYLGLLETRKTDSKKYRGGLLGFHFTGGMLFSLHSLLPKNRRASSYEIQNLWLQAGLQQIQVNNKGPKIIGYHHCNRPYHGP